MTHQTTMTNYLQTFIQGLSNSGVTEVVISPGSRSTPLALLLHRAPHFKTYIAVDERSAAFFALGLTKKTGQAVALLCTSGTAAANYYPAICEAYASGHPLVIITTDRPHELRQVGAPQAMEQLNLFQGHVKEFYEMALPEDSKEMLDYVFWQGLRAGRTSQQSPMGPVHLNFPLREPLLPDLTHAVPQVPIRTIHVGTQRLSVSELLLLTTEWSHKKGVIIVGGAHSHAEALNLIALAEQLAWPIFGDPLANLLTTGDSSPSLISHSDLFIDYLPAVCQPEVVIQFGVLPLSKNTMKWLGHLEATKTTRYFIDETSQWQEQLKTAQHIIQANEQALIADLIALDALIPAPNSWLNHWQTIASTVTELVDKTTTTELNESNASRVVHESMVAAGQLFVANSMPIRYLDRYLTRAKQPYQVYGNRGINGIDGIVSSALGMTAKNPLGQNVLLVGDLTLYHDMNGLIQGKKYNLPLTIVLLNNNGGGIFSFLSQNQLNARDFEPLFGTPLELDFSLVAELYQAAFTCVTSLAELRHELAQVSTTLRIIEVKTERADNPQHLANLKKTIKESLAHYHET